MQKYIFRACIRLKKSGRLSDKDKEEIVEEINKFDIRPIYFRLGEKRNFLLKKYIYLNIFFYISIKCRDEVDAVHKKLAIKKTIHEMIKVLEGFKVVEYWCNCKNMHSKID
ncbi:hypothetical protein C0583_06460 [Candidatus Parcubacteria bacterium]|nr:MAG: hypothetical protein C0583_06460 [Candidatus Parcubacteria bacterium]